jgi:type II secretory pathway pseudopilin PulG
VMTVALYLIGSLVATAVTKWLNNKDRNRRALQDESVWSYQY